jgi:hypothetical protein
MSQLPKLTTVAQGAWKFSLDFNVYLRRHELLDEFAGAASADELKEWRDLHSSIHHLNGIARHDDKGQYAAYAEVLMLRLAEMNARIGGRVFGNKFMGNFLPKTAHEPELFRKLSSPALAQVSSLK